MSTFELELLSDAAAQKPQPKLSPFDYATKLLLPTVAILVAAFTKNLQPPMFWGLLAFGFVSFSAGFYEPTVAKFQFWSERREDRRVARAAFPKLRSFAHRFEKYVGGSADTIHYIAQSDVCDGNGLRYNALGLPNVAVWQAFWKDLTDRLDRTEIKHAEILELRYEMSAFFELVSTYNNQCVSALFDRLPQAERDALTAKAKSSLNSFHIQFTHFLEEYKNFAVDVCESRPAMRGIHFSFAVQKPMS